jgi:hypothetical protein
MIIGEHFALDSRMVRTVLPFLLLPGFLTREFNRGRRMHYSAPFRLYLLMSLLLFLGLGISRFAADFALVQQVGSVTDRQIPPTPPGGLTVLTEPATKAIATLTETLNSPPWRYEQSISWTILDLFGEDHPLSRFISTKMTKLREMDWAEARLAGFDNWLNLVPTAMFLLLPFCAAVLKICFLGTGRYYVEHLVFTLHLHAFIYLMLLLLCWTWSPATIVIAVTVIVGHILVGLQTAYQRFWLATLMRGLLFLALFVATLLIGLGMTFCISLMLL